MAAKFVSPYLRTAPHQGSHSLEMASRMVYRVVSVLSLTSLLYYGVEPGSQSPLGSNRHPS